MYANHLPLPPQNIPPDENSENALTGTSATQSALVTGSSPMLFSFHITMAAPTRFKPTYASRGRRSCTPGMETDEKAAAAAAQGSSGGDVRA